MDAAAGRSAAAGHGAGTGDGHQPSGCAGRACPQIVNLSDRLRLGWRPEGALRAFAEELDDVTADKVVAALILSVNDRGPGSGPGAGGPGGDGP